MAGPVPNFKRLWIYKNKLVFRGTQCLAYSVLSTQLWGVLFGSICRDKNKYSCMFSSTVSQGHSTYLDSGVCTAVCTKFSTTTRVRLSSEISDYMVNTLYVARWEKLLINRGTFCRSDTSGTLAQCNFETVCTLFDQYR
jgi:hypothetical protein